ncbi:hypothetical protein [uncultured Clostridium sp.]
MIQLNYEPSVGTVTSELVSMWWDNDVIKSSHIKETYKLEKIKLLM